MPEDTLARAGNELAAGSLPRSLGKEGWEVATKGPARQPVTREKEMSKSTDEQNALKDSADAIAEYLFAYGGDRTQFMVYVDWAVEERLTEIREEDAKERALDAKAEELGVRY